MNKKYMAEIKVTGNKEDLKDFLLFCRKLEYLCNVGSSREIKLYVDGDGSADLNFDFGKIEVNIDKDKLEKQLNSGKPIEHNIGE